ncbi:predicted protein [Streptomyces viridosporus ATCC 14672]|uniref:Predicted protein n=1 Tax=Streptomyces viridosporus (strain ATCC 14672 / DSM 40746 / JCM 4963 / KCTC 9882 / NRRL B-12104 / FH 1290) TaxID=566461 RepID=D6A285_STRV1|nr:predicted protein [Streptomyces viridosporus ATCC 14672]
MLNRIRRAVSLTRARHFPRGRHRRPLTPFQPTSAPISSASVDQPTIVLGHTLDRASHWQPLRGEDTALVRPYILAHEERARRHPTVVIASQPPTDAWSALLGVH